MEKDDIASYVNFYKKNSSLENLEYVFSAAKSISKLIDLDFTPISIIPGNHDYDIFNNKSLVSNYSKYFSSYLKISLKRLR